MWKLYQPQSACVHPVGARREKHRRASPSSGGNRPPAPPGACAYLRPRSRGCGGASSAGPPSNPEGQQGRTCGVSRNGVARAPPRKATGPPQAPLRPFGATVTPARAGSVLESRIGAAVRIPSPSAVSATSPRRTRSEGDMVGLDPAAGRHQRPLIPTPLPCRPPLLRRRAPRERMGQRVEPAHGLLRPVEPHLDPVLVAAT